MTATITVSGGLTNAPELRVVGNDNTVINFTVASTERYKDREGNWKDGKTLYLRCEAWRDMAQGIEGSLRALDKGTQVTVAGKLYTHQWEATDGTKRSEVKLDVTDLAVSVKRATVTATRNDRSGGAGSPQPVQNATHGYTGTQSVNGPQGAAQDVWGAPAAVYNDEIPF